MHMHKVDPVPLSALILRILFQELLEFVRLFGVSGWWKSATDVVPFQIMIIDYKLTYPSGTATAVLINGFHTTHGDATAKQQVNWFTKYFAISFFWSFFQWFYSGGDNCGFSQFPTFGLRAWKQT
ncbi:Metal-nicotianamine transporter YSL2 [Zea mays]|uniref:Metal-nicotianamine transporter YSL2 n=1 Tax=Zea mays TaxID=4577 RepID=A0A1D6H3S5_MAIZE|nr:Metal-nicotianamine transporter YSL2 [Zea mays]